LVPESKDEVRIVWCLFFSVCYWLSSTLILCYRLNSTLIPYYWLDSTLILYTEHLGMVDRWRGGERRSRDGRKEVRGMGAVHSVRLDYLSKCIHLVPS
jgi:hypothetical protein